MDIAEKRVPQDGRFPINVEGRQFDIRASTLPTHHGEKMVLRLLEKTSGLPQLTLSQLGFSKNVLDSYEKPDKHALRVCTFNRAHGLR